MRNERETPDGELVEAAEGDLKAWGWDDDSLLLGERMSADELAALRAAFDTLPPRCRQLLGMLMADPPHSYAEISAAVSIPIGSIGPQRHRCLERLRRTMAALDRGQDAPRTPADQRIGSLFSAAEVARLSHEPAYNEAAALTRFNAWLDGNTESPTVIPQPGQLLRAGTEELANEPKE
jgi:hypothetical protein